MSIYQGSRYYNQYIDHFATIIDGDDQPVVFYAFDTLGLQSWIEHTYVEGERLDQIADKYFRNPAVWWLIPEYNPQIEDFTSIAGGTIIRIPNV